MSADPPVKTDAPHDRLTYLCDEMTKPLEREENADVKGIVLLDDGTHGGIVLHGYTDMESAIVDLFVHMRGLFEANGKRLEIFAMPNSAEGL